MSRITVKRQLPIYTMYAEIILRTNTLNRGDTECAFSLSLSLTHIHASTMMHLKTHLSAHPHGHPVHLSRSRRRATHVVVVDDVVVGDGGGAIDRKRTHKLIAAPRLKRERERDTACQSSR